MKFQALAKVELAAFGESLGSGRYLVPKMRMGESCVGREWTHVVSSCSKKHYFWYRAAESDKAAQGIQLHPTVIPLNLFFE